MIFLNFSHGKEIGSFNDWAAYAEGEGKNLACMAVSKPKKAKGNYKKRGDIFAELWSAGSSTHAQSSLGHNNKKSENHHNS